MRTKESRAILAASLAIWIFLLWLIYGRGTVVSSGQFLWLPHLNAALNGTTAILLLSGYFAIKKGSTRTHIGLMSLAVASSTLFLISYCIYHYYHGHTPFEGVGTIRSIYFSILISHILLSIVQVPLIGFTLFFALKKQYRQHKKVARWTLPVWLYVSATGVAVFFFLQFT